MTAFDRPALERLTHAEAQPAPSALLPDWVFGYGSLIWNPDFEFAESVLARVHGYHRTFCIRSTRYRGTPERPGVVLGLDRGGSCVGMAFRLEPGSRRRAIDALYAREMTGGVYRAQSLCAVLDDGRRIRALGFVADRSSPAYEALSDAQILARLSTSCGQRGPNREYALRTWLSLSSHGVHCPHLDRIGRLLLAAGER